MKVLILLLLFLAGCTVSRDGEKMTQKDYEKLDQTIGPWENPYAGDSKLAGVVIRQFSEGIIPKRPYERKHPSSIWYVFWNGDVRSIEYGPDGSIIVDSYWRKCFKTSSDWRDVEFFYGSDPEFRRHKDPRK